MTTTTALTARRDLQHSLLALVTLFETQIGNVASHRDTTARLWPAVSAMQRLGYKILAICWSLEERGTGRAEFARGLGAPGDFAEIADALTKLAESLRVGSGPVDLVRLPDFLQAEVRTLNGSLVSL